MAHRCTAATALALLMAASGAVTSACGGSSAPSGETPVAALGSSREAQTEYQNILRRWSRASRTERVALEPDLAAFRRKFPEDDLGRVVDALIAWAALDADDLDRAEKLSRQVQARGAGTAKDIAQVVEGAALRRRRKPEEALAKLSPIVSKLIDDYARAFLNEEVVAAALEAKRFTRAVALMDVWLRESDAEERRSVRARIEQIMPGVPPEDLTKVLDARLARAHDDEPEEDLDMRRILAQALARVARARKDATLAQHLMATSGPLLGEQGDAVAQLAAGSGKARVEAPTVGLLLSLRSDEARRRGVEVAGGVMHGLGLPGSAARIVSRDDGGSLEQVQEALSALTSDGAAILIAGSDEEEATEAASFAESRGIPVVLLRPPKSPVQPSGFVFVVGFDRTQVRAALALGLVERGSTKVAVVSKGDGGASALDARATNGLQAVATHTCGSPFDVAAWKSAGVNGVVFDGDAECSRAVAAAVSPLRQARLAFSYDALPAQAPLPANALVLSAGYFPLVAGATSAPWLKVWQTQRLTPPSFWAALGRDAGVLAWEGVEALPAQGTEDPKEIQIRRVAARDALAAATAELWTTEARGFAGARVLPRRLGVSELKQGAAR
jgi:ABC-type sugar transport system substrate-binding protein